MVGCCAAAVRRDLRDLRPRDVTVRQSFVLVLRSDEYRDETTARSAPVSFGQTCRKVPGIVRDSRRRVDAVTRERAFHCCNCGAIEARDKPAR